MSYHAARFLTQAATIHKNYYDYSMVVYVNATTEVIIICPSHGAFLQTPSEHLRKKRTPCIICSQKRKRRNFLSDFNQIHNNRYKYIDLPKDLNGKSRIDIECSNHGTFTLSVKSHLMGVGCPICYHQKTGHLPRRRELKYLNRVKCHQS